MASVSDELTVRSCLIILNLNSQAWLVITVLGGTDLDQGDL